jgi:ribosomal peptide maturation radical SAM protein 1
MGGSSAPSSRRVLLLSLPFGALNRPSLGLSLLKGVLSEADIPCDVRYLTFPFAELIGHDDYSWISSDVPYTAFAGDWCFAEQLYGFRDEVDRAYVQDILSETWRLDHTAIRRVLRIRSLAQPFLDHCMAAIPWSRYAVVGFTSTFEQNLASLALATRLKGAYPDITIVCGGANWEGIMGLELHRQFPCVDFVCSGEAERSFPAVARRLLADAPRAVHLGLIPGIVYRHDGASVSTGPPLPVRNLDELPIPDFSDYYLAVEQSTVGASVVPTLLIETSRGCWWGAKSHCTFCGLNGESMAFRSKSSGRVLSELETLAGRWKPDMVEAVDNILDMRYFRDLLPALAETPHSYQMFYEVKANLTKAQVRLLADAGVSRIQPGIESFSNHVLQLMRKGTTALRNIQLLKWCKLYGVQTDWNLLYGFPGEAPEDYVQMLELLPAIRFLDPPAAWGPVRLDRFSPYHRDPAAFGLQNVRPVAPYRYLYPGDEDSLARIAYYFDYDFAPGQDPSGYGAAVVAFLERWKRQPEPGSLFASVCDDGSLELTDTRSDAAVRTMRFTGLERAAYEYCDELRSLSGIVRYLQERFAEADFGQPEVVTFLDSLIATRLMVSDGHHYLSLALQRGQEPMKEADWIHLRQVAISTKNSVDSAVPVA